MSCILNVLGYKYLLQAREYRQRGSGALGERNDGAYTRKGSAFPQRVWDERGLHFAFAIVHPDGKGDEQHDADGEQ